jgi:hypothetical protein
MASISASDAFPGFDHFFELADTGSDRAFVASLDLSPQTALALLRDETRQRNIARGRWAMGSIEPQDIVWTTLASPILLSQRVVDIFEENGFSGWAITPCELRGKDDSVFAYYLLRVSGRCGAIDDSRSVQIEKQFPGGRFPVWKGLYFDPATWDGSDLFMPASNVGWIFVTEKVKLILERAKIKDAKLVALGEIERMPPLRNPNTLN